MASTLAVIAPEDFALDQTIEEVARGEVDLVGVRDGGLPLDAAGLFVYAPDGQSLGTDVGSTVDQAMAAGIPVLGSAAGSHVLNVVLGGDGPKETTEHIAPEDGSRRRTMMFLAPGAKVSSTIGGSGWLGIECDHPQGISQAGLAPGLMASAIGDDRVIEAFEMPGHHWVLGVQWDVFRAKRLPRGFDAVWLAFMERVVGV